MTFVDLNLRLAKWIKFHNYTLMAATLHALALPLDITRAGTHVVRVRLMPRFDHNSVTSKFFRVINAQVIKISEAKNLRSPWPESLEQLDSLRKESESKQRGTIAAMGIECLPLGVQFVPFGSLKDVSSLRILPNWKEILIKDVENGKKFTQFGY